MPWHARFCFLISVLVFLSSCQSSPRSAKGDPVKSFEIKLMEFASKLRARGVALEFDRVSHIRRVSNPLEEVMEILNSARFLVERHGQAEEAWTLDQLDVPELDQRRLAAKLVSREVIRRKDYLTQIDWSLNGQKFQTWAAVHPMHPNWDEDFGFEPLLYFTPLRSEVVLDSDSLELIIADQKGISTQPHLPPASGFSSFESRLVSDHVSSALKVKYTSHVQKSWKLIIWNAYDACATVVWNVSFRTDGCSILDSGDRAYSDPPVISSSFSCLFWGVESQTNEERGWIAQPKCPPRPGSGEGQEECLEFTLVYRSGLRFARGFFPLTSPANVPQKICCKLETDSGSETVNARENPFSSRTTKKTARHSHLPYAGWRSVLVVPSPLDTSPPPSP